MADLLVTTADEVSKRLRMDIDPDDHEFIEGLIEEAGILIDGYLGKIPHPVPHAVSVVASRMVARVMESPTDGFGQESSSYSAGPFSKNVTYSAGASGGSPWLTAVDKKSLRRFKRRGGGVFSVEVG